MSTLTFDPYDYALQDDPYPTYRRMRDEEPLHHNEEHDFWVLTRHDDVNRVFRTDKGFSSRMGVTLDASAWTRHAHRTMSFLAMDPPESTRLRRLVSKGFTPRRIAGLEGQIQRITDHYLEQCLEAGEFDWVGDLAGKVPMDATRYDDSPTCWCTGSRVCATSPSSASRRRWSSSATTRTCWPRSAGGRATTWPAPCSPSRTTTTG
jgi:cytochrome P450